VRAVARDVVSRARLVTIWSHAASC
jgi:hypothetical protein